MIERVERTSRRQPNSRTDTNWRQEGFYLTATLKSTVGADGNASSLRCLYMDVALQTHSVAKHHRSLILLIEQHSIIDQDVRAETNPTMKGCLRGDESPTIHLSQLLTLIVIRPE